MRAGRMARWTCRPSSAHFERSYLRTAFDPSVRSVPFMPAASATLLMHGTGSYDGITSIIKSKNDVFPSSGKGRVGTTVPYTSILPRIAGSNDDMSNDTSAEERYRSRAVTVKMAA